MNPERLNNERKGPRWRDLPWGTREELNKRRKFNREVRHIRTVESKERRKGLKRRDTQHHIRADRAGFAAYQKLPGLAIVLDDLHGRERYASYTKRNCLRRLLVNYVKAALLELRESGIPISDEDLQAVGIVKRPHDA